MFKINQLIKRFFRKKELDRPNILIEDKDIIMVSVLLDCQTNDIISVIDAKPYMAEDSRMTKQAESFALMLNRICGENVDLIELIIDNINVLKKKSNDHLLFYSNVLFFWKHLADNQKQTHQDNTALVRPTQVFKH